MNKSLQYIRNPYLVTTAIVIFAAALRIWPLHILETRVAWLTFYPAVMVAAAYGGLFAGLLGTLLTCLIVVFWWPLLVANPFIQTSADWVGMGGFIVSSVLISYIAETMRRAQAKAKQSEDALKKHRDHLEGLVAERTTTLETTNANLLKEIIKRNHVQEQLIEAEAKYRTVADFTYDWEWLQSPAGEFIYVSPSCKRVTGRDTNEFIADAGLLRRIIHPDDQLIWDNHRHKTVRGEAVSSIQFRITHIDGSELWIEHICQPIFDSTNSFVGTRGSNHDISERKRNELRNNTLNSLLSLFLRVSVKKEYLNSTVNLLGKWSGCRCVGVRALDGDGNIPYEASMGFSREFLESESKLNIKKDQCACTRVISAKPESQDMPFITAAGTFCCNNTLKLSEALTEEEQARFRGVCIRSGFNTVGVFPLRYREQILGAIHLADEREKKLSLRTMELIESIAPVIGEAIYRFSVEEDNDRIKQRNEMILNSAGEGIYGIGLDGKTTFVNTAAAALLGYDTAELIGKPGHATIHHTRPDGAPYPIEKCPIYATLRGESARQVDDEVFWSKDGTSFPVTYTSTPARSKSGKIVGVVIVFRDITSHKQAEEERGKMQRQLIAQDRLASIGQMVAGVAHEINNPLTSVIGFSDLLLERDLPSDVKDDLKIVNDEAHRTSKIVKGLLTFARKQPEKKEPVDINAQVKIIIELSNHRHKTNNIQVNTHFAEDLPQITANASQLQQVFLNIVMNAEQAMLEAHSKGVITVTTEQSGDIVKVYLADNGPGISPENMRKLFTPFFTTKPVGKGTGLGLSICHGIITEHGGRIYAESEPGKGAAFIVELPVKQATTTHEVGDWAV